jgi:hypothetical protein
MNDMLSNCCKAPINIDLTKKERFYLCTNCNKPCSAFVEASTTSSYGNPESDLRAERLRNEEAEVWTQFMSAGMVRGFEDVEQVAKEADFALEEWRKRWRK